MSRCDSTQGAGGCPGGDGFLAVEPQKGLALLEYHEHVVSGEPAASGRVTFEGIALGPGVYVDAAERRIRVREEHLPLVAERVKGVFLRDLHREDMGASVGVVAGARVDGREVRFTGDVRLAPYVELIRHFWPHIRFSLGFRYDPARLQASEDGTYDLPADFVIDHLALVPQGQYPNARLVRLLNQARGLAPAPVGEPVQGPFSAPPDASLIAPLPAAPPSLPRTEPMAEHKNESEAASEASRRDELRLQRDEALKAAEASKAELEQARGDLTKELAKARADLEAATKLAEAARLELGQAKNRFSAEVMKLELAAGKDFDLDQRKKELTGLELGALDKLRGVLRLAAAEAAADDDGERTPPPATRADPAPGGSPVPRREALQLDGLGFMDTLRLAAEQGVL